MTKDPDATNPTAEMRARKREESKAAAKVVMADIEARKAAAQVNTDRLRALRLDKEAADKAKAAEVQAMAKSKGRKRDAHAAVGKSTRSVRGGPRQ